MRPFTTEAHDIHMPPVKPSTRRMGIRMDGCEVPLENILRQSLAMCPPNQCYTLVEVGSAGCTTLRAFKDIVSEVRGQAPWRIVGFDLPPGKAWSLDVEEAKKNGVDQIIDCPKVNIPPERSMSLILVDSPRLYIQDDFPFPISFAFIDGCHGKCAGRDFEALEAKIIPGGLVVFHDYGEAEQGTDFQIHCREFISVRSYVHRLGLASPCKAPRKGWHWIGEIQGTRVLPQSITVADSSSRWERVKAVFKNKPFSTTISLVAGDGNSCAVVQRNGDPLEYNADLAIIDEPVVTFPLPPQLLSEVSVSKTKVSTVQASEPVPILEPVQPLPILSPKAAKVTIKPKKKRVITKIKKSKRRK